MTTAIWNDTVGVYDILPSNFVRKAYYYKNANSMSTITLLLEVAENVLSNTM